MNKKAFTIKELGIIVGLYVILIFIAMPTVKDILNIKKNNQNVAINQENTQVVVNTAAEVVLENESCDKRVPGAGLYYRGNGMYNFVGENPDNWVNFDGKLWRILRINEDNTLRLIYPESIGNSPANASNTTTFVGGAFQKYLNDWYNSNISTTAKAKVIDGKFCDGALISYGNMVKDFASECNSTVTVKVGLMNASDYANAAENVTSLGISTSQYTFYFNKNWLHIGINEWVLNPVSSYNLSYVFSAGYLTNASVVSNSYGLRPVINLTSSITITAGIGTQSNPYILN